MNTAARRPYRMLSSRQLANRIQNPASWPMSADV